MNHLRVQYTRRTGKRLTYDIEVDEGGSFCIRLNGVVLKRGVDMLVKTGVRGRGEDAQQAALRHAYVAVDYLIGMPEEPVAAKADDTPRRRAAPRKKAAV